jgi:hypothetical protein
VPDDRRAANSERGDQPKRVLHQIEQMERRKIAVIAAVPSDGASIAALIGRDRVKAGGGQCRQHLTPTVGEFRKAVQQQDAGSIPCLESSLQHMHAKAIAVVQHA